MANNSINKAMATAKSVAKKGVKVFAAALPIMSVATNVAIAAEKNPGNLSGFLTNLQRRYTGVDPETGQFRLNEAMMGAGSLIISTAAGAILTALA